MTNSERVFAEARGKADDLVLKALLRHPAVQLVLRYSGSRSEWPVTTRPDHLERLVNPVTGKQIELLAGEYRAGDLKPMVLRETKRE